MSASLVKYVLKAAIRDRLVIALLLIMVVASSLSLFMGSAAIVEQDQFTYVFASGSFRLAGVFALILFTVFFIRRSFEARDIEYLLSRPISRPQFLLSYAGGLSILAIITAFIQTFSLAIIMQFNLGEGFALWALSIVIENIIIVNVALFFSLFLSSAAGASMAVIGFYVLSRMIGQILGVLQTGKSSLFEGLEVMMKMVSVVIPRLDLMGQSSWLLYGVDDTANIGFIIIQCGVFILLILALGMIDLMKRQF